MAGGRTDGCGGRKLGEAEGVIYVSGADSYGGPASDNRCWAGNEGAVMNPKTRTRSMKAQSSQTLVRDRINVQLGPTTCGFPSRASSDVLVVLYHRRATPNLNSATLMPDPDGRSCEVDRRVCASSINATPPTSRFDDGAMNA